MLVQGNFVLYQDADHSNSSSFRELCNLIFSLMQTGPSSLLRISSNELNNIVALWKQTKSAEDKVRFVFQRESICNSYSAPYCIRNRSQSATFYMVILIFETFISTVNFISRQFSSSVMFRFSIKAISSLQIGKQVPSSDYLTNWNYSKILH